MSCISRNKNDCFFAGILKGNIETEESPILENTTHHNKLNSSTSAREGFLERILQSRVLVYIIIFPLALFLYWDIIGLFFFSDDFGCLYRAIYNFNFQSIFIDQFFNGFFYRPLSFDFSFKLGHILFGLNPTGYRLIVLFLFCLTCILVYETVSLVTKRKDAGFLAMFFFLTRAAHGSTILWISPGFQQMGSTLFMLGAFYLFVRYKQSLLFSFYLGSVLCAILSTLSRESAIVLPALIIALEYAWRKSLKSFFSRSTLLRVLPFCFVALIPLSRLVLNTHLSLNQQKGFYATEYSLSVIIKNLSFAIVYSFNTVPEMCILAVWVIITVFRRGQGKLVLSACGLFLIGIVTQLFLKNGLEERGICFALIGVALLLSIGLKTVQARLPAFKPYLVIILLTLFFTTFATVRLSSKPCQTLFELEQVSRKSITYLKKIFPELPDKSFIYIQNSDVPLMWTLYKGKAIKIFYNDSITVCFEGVTKKENLPKQCSGIYVFNYINNELRFTRFVEGRFLEEFLKEHFVTHSPE